MGCACMKLLRDLSEYALIPCIRAYSFAPVRVTSSVCLRVRGLSLYVDTRTTISARLKCTVLRPLNKVFAAMAARSYLRVALVSMVHITT